MLETITGTDVNYYYVCKIKLWFCSHGINMEKTSQHVEIGKLIHEDSFKKEKKEILIDGIIKLDFIDKKLTIHETKKSKAMEEASIKQLQYYIYYLKNKGVDGINGIIHYPKSKKKKVIELLESDIVDIENCIREIEKIKKSMVPPTKVKTKICDKCSYYELCFC